MHYFSSHQFDVKTNTCNVIGKGPTESLRAVVSNFRESGDKANNSNFFLFAQKNPFGELFSKVIFKSSSEFLFWQKSGKFEIGLNGPSDPM